MCNDITFTMVVYCFLSLIGNLIGGVLMSIMPLIKRKDTPKKYKCPCCGYYTFEKKHHEYEICPVCYWEDDPVQKNDPTFKGGANHISLEKAKENFEKFGACEEKHIKDVRKPRNDELHGYDR